MSSPSKAQAQKSAAVLAILYAAALTAAWIGAWPLESLLKLSSPFSQFVYWLVMRVLLWVLPSVFLIRRSGRAFREVLGAGRIREILLWGGIAGLVWGGKTPLFMYLANQPLHPAILDWSFVTAVIYGPLVEEITFRGAIMGTLNASMRFAWANLLNGLFFLLIHFPGWYYSGFLARDFITVSSSALGILLLGWILGFVAHRSKSVTASTLAHMLNNFFQRFSG